MPERKIHTPVKKGSFILISQGAYSEYGPIAFGRAKTDLDLDSLRNEYIVQNPDRPIGGYSYLTPFVKWLVVDKDCIEEVQYREWHFDDPDRLEFDVEDHNPVT